MSNLKQYNMNTEQFLKEIKGSKFENDLDANNTMARYNLIVSIRDCKLFSKGLKPHRNWKITDVKRYFNVKGNADTIAQKLEQYKVVLNEN
jgi:hypothetical protein